MMHLHRLALGLGTLILTQSPTEAWAADDYEDIDLLKDPKKKTPKPEIIRKPVQENENPGPVQENENPVAAPAMPSGVIEASLSVPLFDPSIQIEVSVGRQRFTVTPGTMMVPAGRIGVHATRTHPAGEVRTLDYEIDIPASGGRLQLPHTLDIWVGGQSDNWWFLPPHSPDPPATVPIGIPGVARSLPGKTSGLLLGEGEVLEVRIPNDARPFTAHRQWREANAKALPTFTLAGLSMLTGAGLIVEGLIQHGAANVAKQQAEAIDDPTQYSAFKGFEESHLQHQSTGNLLVGLGAAAAAIGVTLVFVPGQKLSAEVSRTKNALTAEQPIMLHDYLAPTATAPSSEPQVWPAETSAPAPQSPEPAPAGNDESENVWE